MLSGILAAATLALGVALVNNAQPAKATALPMSSASCTVGYSYAPVAREDGAAAITNISNQTMGHMWASLWVRFYMNAQGKFVPCGRYYLAVRVCAVAHGTLPAGIVTAFIANEQTGVAGYSAADFSLNALSNGACQVFVGSETPSGEIVASALVRGIGHYSSLTTSSGTVMTTVFNPTAHLALTAN
jgi:hypothetical protein